jgi:hypothetical protein
MLCVLCYDWLTCVGRNRRNVMGPIDQHVPIAGGAMAGHPYGRTIDRPTLPYRGLADSEVIAEARRIYAELQETPRWANNRDALLVAWGAVCAEMNVRGLTDDITTAHAERTSIGGRPEPEPAAPGV